MPTATAGFELAFQGDRGACLLQKRGKGSECCDSIFSVSFLRVLVGASSNRDALALLAAGALEHVLILVCATRLVLIVPMMMVVMLHNHSFFTSIVIMFICSIGDELLQIA